MSTHAIRTKGRSATAAVGILLALALAVSVLAIQGHSIWSTATDPVVPPASVQIDVHHYKNDLPPGVLQPDRAPRGSFHRIPKSQLENRKSG